MSFSALRDTIVSIGVNLEACVSGDAVKARLKEVVDNEDKSDPTNDAEAQNVLGTGEKKQQPRAGFLVVTVARHP